MFETLIAVAGYAGIIVVVIAIAWLSHREIRKSTTETNTSERSLEEERNLLERRIAERTETLIEMEREKTENRTKMAQFGELSQGLFHDLMNPLSSLSIYLEKLEASGNASGETRENMNKIVGISKRMNTFMDSVKRSIGKIDSLPQQNSADIATELGMVRDVLAYKARMAGVKMIVEHCDPISLPIHPVRLHQLLVNLVSNAIEACTDPAVANRDEEKWVKITVTKDAANHRGTTITVSDNGCGISIDRLPTLFKNPMSTKSGGIGIGLTTVKSIVENELMGKISVESEVGKGTTFSITVPSK
jgi:signal transduction histidine kinase